MLRRPVENRRSKATSWQTPLPLAPAEVTTGTKLQVITRWSLSSRLSHRGPRAEVLKQWQRAAPKALRTHRAHELHSLYSSRHRRLWLAPALGWAEQARDGPQVTSSGEGATPLLVFAPLSEAPSGCSSTKCLSWLRDICAPEELCTTLFELMWRSTPRCDFDVHFRIPVHIYSLIP